MTLAQISAVLIGAGAGLFVVGATVAFAPAGLRCGALATTASGCGIFKARGGTVERGVFSTR